MLLSQHTTVCKVQALVRSYFPTFDLFTLFVVKSRIYFWFTSPAISCVPVGMVHERLREQGWVDAIQYPAADAVSYTKRDTLWPNEQLKNVGA
jgi:hypothetical protein